MTSPSRPAASRLLVSRVRWVGRQISRALRGARRLLRVVAALVLLAAVLVGGYAFQQLRAAQITLRDVPALTNPESARLPQPVEFYSAENIKIGSRRTEKRLVVGPREIPDVMRKAMIAIEDQRFYRHNGVDFQGIMRSAWVNVRAGQTVQGASTITMQYVRNVYLDFERTGQRKIKEIALALQLESIWDKDRILNAYLNTVNFGLGQYGVEAAARGYFGVPARKLTIAQAALLAGIVQNPTSLEPRGHADAALKRRALVLDEMYAQGAITRSEVLAAKREPLELVKRTDDPAPRDQALLDYLDAELSRHLDGPAVKRGGLKVRTSLRLREIQRTRTTLKKAYPGLSSKRAPVVAAAFVAPRTGRIVVLAHSKNGRFDYSWQARRQPGSTVKPMTVAAYLSRGGQLSDGVDNSPLTVKRQNGSKYTVQPTQGGVTNVQDALRFSQNPSMWRLYQKAGPKRVLSLQRRSGMTQMDSNPAAALGGVRRGTNPLELASAYGVFANDGTHAPAHAITEIVDTLGNTVWDDRKLQPKKALAPEYARQTAVALQRTVKDGLAEVRQNVTLARTRPVGGKTGTTEDNADAWFAGVTPQLSGVVWTGYGSVRKSLRNLPGAGGGEVYGASIPAKTWNTLAKRLLRGTPAARFPSPTGVQRVPSVTGLSLELARARLAQFGFGVVVTERFDASTPPMQVIKVSHRAGQFIRRGTQVIVTVATDKRSMPQFVGRPYVDVFDRLGRFGEVTITPRVSSEPPGTILEQSPDAGLALPAGTPIALVVASPPGPVQIKREEYVPSDSELATLRRERDYARDQVTVPNVVGLDVTAARAVLQSLGLQSTVTGSGEIVVGQSVPAGTRKPDGSTVTMTLQGDVVDEEPATDTDSP